MSNQIVQFTKNIQAYHARWLLAAADGHITQEVAGMLIQALELGVAEMGELLQKSAIDPKVAAESAYRTTANALLYLNNHGSKTRWLSFGQQDAQKLQEVSVELGNTVNFRSIHLINKVKSKI